MRGKPVTILIADRTTRRRAADLGPTGKQLRSRVAPDTALRQDSRNSFIGLGSFAIMTGATQEMISIVHNKVPNRIRILVPIIKHKRTYAALLKQTLLKHADAKGVYHAEPNITTGTILIKYHPALHTEGEVVDLVRMIARQLSDGEIEISAKHKNPGIGKMLPQAFFTRELLVSIGGNVIAGLLLAAITAR